MSHESYNQWWIASKRQLEDLQVRDKIMQATTKPTKVRAMANHLVGGLYARYALIVQDLAACLDQNCLIQKRFTMRKLVDAATIRLNELKEELTKINMSEFHYIDGNLIELKLIPYEIQILDPALVYDRSIDIEDMWTKIKNGETIYVPPPPPPEREDETQAPEQALPAEGTPSATAAAPAAGEAPPAEKAPPAEGTQPAEGAQPADGEPPAEGGEEPKEGEHAQPRRKKRRKTIQKYVPPQIVLSPEEIAALKRKEEVTAAVQLIQTHERARQCRLYYNDLDSQRALRRRAIDGPPIPPDAEPEVQKSAAVEIQRVWKGYADRAYLKKHEKDRRLLIGNTLAQISTHLQLHPCSEMHPKVP